MSCKGMLPASGLNCPRGGPGGSSGSRGSIGPLTSLRAEAKPRDELAWFLRLGVDCSYVLKPLFCL